jgi:hypothetical protein
LLNFNMGRFDREIPICYAVREAATIEELSVLCYILLLI